VTTRRQLMIALGASALAAPLAPFAQQQGKVWRVGMLETTSTTLNAANLDAFRQGLRELGYVEGRNLIIEYRSADGRSERFADLAADLVGLKVDLIVTRGTPAAVAAKNATRTIPVVMANAGDPVDSGLVTSLARPGGNLTGLSSLTVNLEAKRLGLLRELVPGGARIAVLYNMSSPNNLPQWKAIETAARAVSIQPQLLDVRKPEDLAPAFDAASRQRADALVVGGEGLFQANRKLIAELAAKHRLPAIYRSMEYIEAGGLMAYGPSYPDLYRRAATYVDKIFRGAKPGDLPVEQPTKFELILNLKTAKALGLTIPPPLLLRADEVIQ
jgi:putative tryptophan/tyrosine transport system substrate-binding protein